MSKDKKNEEATNAIIEVIINEKGKTEGTEGTEEEMEQIKEIIGQIEKEKDRVMKLQKNTKFFRTTLVTADSLKKVIESAKKEGREIDLVSMSEILTGILVVFEERGFIKIIEKD